MKKTIMTALLGVSALAVGCAADAPADETVATPESSAEIASTSDDTVAVTFAALTVLDCNSEAAKCIQANTNGSSSAAATCSAKLNDCLADVRNQTPAKPSKGFTDTLDCADKGVSCISDPSGLLDCTNKTQQCVVDSVRSNTGLGVGAIARLLGVTLDALGTVVGTVVSTGVKVVEPVLDTATGVVVDVIKVGDKVIKPVVNAAGQILDASGKVIGTAVNATGKVVGVTVNAAGEVIDAAGKVIGKTASVAGDVVGGVVEGTTGAVGDVFSGIGDLATCTSESTKCWRDTRDFDACQRKYRTCIRK